MREVALVPEFFNIAVLNFGPFEEFLLDAGAFPVEEIFHSSLGRFMFFLILKFFECIEVPVDE
jgi:hypothetical protein